MGAILSRSSLNHSSTTPASPSNSNKRFKTQITNFSSSQSSGKAQSEPNRTSLRKRTPSKGHLNRHDHTSCDDDDLDSMCAIKRTLSDVSSASPSSKRQQTQNNNKKHDTTLRMSLQIEIGSHSNKLQAPQHEKECPKQCEIRSNEDVVSEDSSNSDESTTSSNNLPPQEPLSSNHNKVGDESSWNGCDNDIDSIEEAYKTLLKNSTLGKTANEILHKKTIGMPSSPKTSSHKTKREMNGSISNSKSNIISSSKGMKGVLKEQPVLPEALRRRTETTGYTDHGGHQNVTCIAIQTTSSPSQHSTSSSSTPSVTTGHNSSLSLPISSNASSSCNNNNHLLLHNPASPFPLTPKSNQPLPVSAFNCTLNDENVQAVPDSGKNSKGLSSSLTTPNGIVLTPLRRRKQVFQEDVQTDVSAPVIQVLSPEEQQVAVQNKPHLKWAEQKKRNMIKNRSQSRLICDGEMLGVNKAQKKKVKIRTSDDQEILLIK
ncbi:hypothetical protein C9374_006897 [Naegleria lovaniensis]|uniref:Uncharacterized protein n=1 Tax=Naegleria lovaniensis TaxID=51637 RepID=A0AA88KRK0_NAELO|nr:uncharacterized protein C9374_006897 [Naegleria lovaniensis]KAG2393366.1 hypothetical protein C9374_006897 [Naegleria lovaniensis]